MDQAIIDWLLDGDVSIQYQTYRDLLDTPRPDLQARIATEGWGADFLAARNPNGIWGRKFYQPKWISSHYTLLDLRLLEAPPDHPLIRQSIAQIARDNKGIDGGINPHTEPDSLSDVCVNGMFLHYACYFGVDQEPLISVVDYLLDLHMADGGFNCRVQRSGAHHSSVHTTIAVLEGIAEYAANGYDYRLAELEAAAAASREFLLQHRLFKSDRTGEVIHKDLLKLTFPPRWKYNILRALDHFRRVGHPWDDRLSDALDVLIGKRRADGYWPNQAAHPGQVHFVMEAAGQSGRWNTLLALRVLRTYNMSSP